MAKKKAKKSEFYKLRAKLGISITATADLCGVTQRAVQLWDIKGAPLYATRLLHYWDKKRLSHPDWRGWHISSNGKLYGPNRVQYTPEFLRHWSHNTCRHCHQKIWPY